MNVIAVIPARGGSKGVPRKNVKPLLGLPLIAHSILAAKASDFIKRVIVSTDDAEIARISKQYGAEVIERPDDISGDKASSESALLHVLETLKTNENMEPDLLVFLQCTSPLTQTSDIDGAIETLIQKQADSAFTSVRHFHFVWRNDENGFAQGVNHDHTKQRQLRQERAPEYLENGAVYVMRVPAFLQIKRRFCGKTVTFVMPPERALEIDEPLDFTIAEMLLKDQKAKKENAA